NALDDPADAHERAGMHDGRGPAGAALGPHQLQGAAGATELNEAVVVDGTDRRCRRTEDAEGAGTRPLVQEDDVVATVGAARPKAVDDGVHGGAARSRPGQFDVAGRGA